MVEIMIGGWGYRGCVGGASSGVGVGGGMCMLVSSMNVWTSV